ncbi:BTAD domain-containing putative transcriptional regulator [Kitasatospora sp. NPDC059146]|uniref:BTAD domain-containing putative transcriptional regulator n=1 Tax=unclassified Kitasatospora TaxID=2633591 RepID=UPI0036CC7DD8
MGHIEAPRCSPDAVRFTLLSGVEAHRGGQRLHLGPPQRKAVLCALVFRRRQWVSAQSLLDALYEESVPASGIGVIQTHVAGLRRVLEPERKPRTPPAVLLSGHGGYQLQIGGEQTDLGEFDRLVAEGERSRDRSDFTGAEQAYARALRLYSGEPLAGIPGPYAAMWQTALTERHLAVLEDSLDVALTLGRCDAVIDKLRVLTTEHPLRERSRALLMRALHLRGRQSDALEVYARTRRLLVDELGVEPGHELRTLHSQILSGRAPAADLTALPDPVSAAAPTATPSTPGKTSPDQPPLTDREEQLATILASAERAAAGEGGLVTVSGLYGHGKSRLLDETAFRIPGTRRVNLPPTTAADNEPLGLLADILGSLGLRPGEGGATLQTLHAGRTNHELADLVFQSLAGSAAGQQLVLLVDNVTFVDEQSLRLLQILAQHLRTSRVLLVLALEEQPWDPVAVQWNAALEKAASAVLHLGKLNESAITELVAGRPGVDRPEELATSIHQATAGIPLTVVALITDQSNLPDPQNVPAFPPEGRFTRALSQVLEHYEAKRAMLLRALAVLHDDRPTLEVIAAACEEPVASVRDKFERMVTVGMLASVNPPQFRHPVVANAMRWLITPQETTRFRVAAAQHARLSGHSARRIAHYLDDLAGPQWSHWTSVLVEAADECLRDNLVQEALRHLQAALRVAAPEERDTVLVKLGQLELWVNPAASLAHLDEALKTQRAAKTAPTAVIPLAWTMASHRQAQAALALMDEVIAETERQYPTTAKAIRASAWMVGALTYEGWASYVQRLRAEQTAGTGAHDPIAAAALTWDDAFNVRCSAQEAMARFPSEGNEDGAWGNLPREVVGILTHIAVWADDLTLAAQLSDQNDDRYFGTIDIYRRVLLSEILIRCGDYQRALDECAPVAGLPLDQVPRRPAALVAQYAHALLGLGRVDEAEQWLDSVTEHANPEAWEWTVVKYVRALICSARGQARQAAAHFLDCGRRNAAWGLNNPAYIAWRSSAAMELLKIGEHERARELAAAELAIAQRWNTPLTIGRAWRAVALTSPEAVTLPLLEQAVGHLRRSETLIELVPALLDLARTCVKIGDTRRARELLLEARGLADPRGMALLTIQIDARLDEIPRPDDAVPTP